MLTARDPLAANNERVKLFASFVNAVALGLIGFAILRPLVEDIANASLSTLWWGLTGLALHGFSHYILGLIRNSCPIGIICLIQLFCAIRPIAR